MKIRHCVGSEGESVIASEIHRPMKLFAEPLPRDAIVVNQTEGFKFPVVDPASQLFSRNKGR